MKYTNIKVAIDSESSEHKEGIEKFFLELVGGGEAE